MLDEYDRFKCCSFISQPSSFIPEKETLFTMQAEKKLSPAATSLSDYDAIKETIQHYIHGGKAGDTGEMKLAFHRDATIFGYVGPDLFAGPIQGLFDWVDQNGAATELEGRVTSIDLVGTVATARIELENWSGHRFTDFFTLLKTDGEWKVMNKVFYLHP
jgi:hypothetical protein